MPDSPAVTPSQPAVVPMHTPARAELANCVTELHGGTWKFLQLRGELLSPTCIDDDDIDLLGTREAVNSLLDTVFTWVKAGRCHAHVAARRPDKTELTLFSIDGRHYAQLDLWVTLPQLDGGRRALTYSDCEQVARSVTQCVSRLPVNIEACVYIHHLVCKRKNLAADRVQRRLGSYVAECRDAGFDDLAHRIDRIAEIQQISTSDAQQTLNDIELDLSRPLSMASSGVKRLLQKIRGAWLSSPRKPTALAVMGCDGAGKTTLAHLLADNMPAITGVYTGKHLYRKSITYKLAVIFLRPLLFQDRERFDEILAPLVYLRACLALRIRFWRHRPTVTLVDRSIVDFLYVNRKTDTPAFCRYHWLADYCGRRIPTIHCIVSHENVMRRKQEVTERGHQVYDEEMFRRFTRQCPTDYVVFNNDAELNESASALKSAMPRLKAA